MSSAQDDLVLIERTKEGDRTAFNDLIYRYERRAYQYAYRLTSSSEEASDIVSDAFLRVFNAIHNFKGQSAFTTWLYRIITNCYLDSRKKERNRPTISLDNAVATDEGEFERQVEDSGATPDEEVEKFERERLVQRALLRIPDYQRAMLVMYHVENLSYEEIAEALDLPIGTVKSRLNRARLSLRDQLAKDKELFQLG
ncbi:MAG: sigma-70 family RNA polymerase sigma factor [Chthonomonas sp.]|nr:sigma-70 family RNA polymerase sigma factor [Chthonomonas sp.]